MQRILKTGISARLVAAFSAVVGFSLLGALAGWLGFASVETAKNQVAKHAFPAFRSAARIGEISTSVVTAMPGFGRAATPAELRYLSNGLQRKRADLHQLVDRLLEMGIRADLQENLRQSVEQLFGIIARQEGLVAERLAVSRSFDHTLAEALGVTETIVELSRTLVENASTQSMAALVGVYDLIEDRSTGDAAFLALDQIAEENLDQLERMTELRLLASRTSHYLNRLSRETSPTEIARLQNSYRQALKIMARRLAFADDPGRREAMRDPLEKLQIHTDERAADNLFGLRVSLVSLDLRIARLTDQGGESGDLLTAYVKEVQKSSKILIDDAIDRSESTITGGRAALVGFSAVSLVAVGADPGVLRPRQPAAAPGGAARGHAAPGRRPPRRDDHR